MPRRAMRRGQRSRRIRTGSRRGRRWPSTFRSITCSWWPPITGRSNNQKVREVRVVQEVRGAGALRSAALAAVVVGAVGSMTLLLRAGQHTPPFLLFVMASWVLAPFAALGIALMSSNRWSRAMRATLYCAAIVVTLGSLAIYGDDARGHRRPQAGFVYVMVPPMS